MTLLLIATADKSPYIALARDKEVLEKVDLVQDRALGRELLVALDALLQRHDLNLENIDRIAVHAGPGHFGGIRQGVIAASLLAFAKDKDIVEVNGATIGEIIDQAISASVAATIQPHY